MKWKMYGSGLLLAVAVLAGSVADAANPPVWVNYQGVLRDDMNNPLDGTYDMVFRFFGPSDVEILIDRHTGAQGGAVTVSDGLFNVLLGAGSTADGSGPGSYNSLAEVFRDYNEVYLEVQIGADGAPGTEVLSPRTRVISAAYALNASNLAGRPITSLLRSDESDAYTFGTLSFSPGTILDLNGTLNMDGTVTKATTSRVFNFNADLLDELHAEQFLRSDATDVKTFGDLQFDAGARLLVDAGTETSPGLAFHDATNTGISRVGGNFAIVVAGGRGLDVASSGDTNITGRLFVTGESGGDNDPALSLNYNGPDRSQIIYFYDNGSWVAESVRWDDANHRFYITDDLHVSGDLSATGAKPFVQNHPYDSGLSVAYVALEGDEAGTYTRGSGRLIDGEARIALGSTFAWVTNPEIGLTAHVTSRSPDAVVYVDSVSTEELVVRNVTGFPTDAEFDYIVHGLRIGFEEFQSVRPRTTEAPVPSEAYYALRREEHPELQRFTAAARFAAMDRPGGRAAGVVSEAGRALRESIGEYDPDFEDPNREAPADAMGGVDSSKAARNVSADKPPVDAPSDASAVGRIDEPIAESKIPEAREVHPLFPVSGAVEPGDLLALDPERSGVLVRAATAQNPAIVGIAAGEPVEVDGELRVALVETLYSVVKADAGYGEIRPGDLLTSSFTPGHAMWAGEIVPGTIIGKALEPLESGTGLIKVLVMPR
jgi:hypothetical protein